MVNETSLRIAITRNLAILRADTANTATLPVDILTVHVAERLLDQVKTWMVLNQFTGRVAHNGHAIDPITP